MTYKNRICGIYMIVSPTGRVYIGQSVNILSRFNSYIKLSKTNEKIVRLYTSFKKHGVYNHSFTVLEECSSDLLNGRERFWQDYFDVCGKKGLNCRLTSTNDKKPFISAETRLKMSISAKNKVMTDEHLEKLRLSAKSRIGIKTRPRTEEEKEHLRKIILEIGLFQSERNPMYGNARFGDKNPFFGKTHTADVREKLSKKAKGRKYSEETKKLLSSQRQMGLNSSAKLVLNTETGIYYDCGKEAWMASCGMTYSTFKSKLNGSNKYPTSFRYV